MIYILGKILNDQLRYSLDILNISYKEIENTNVIDSNVNQQILILKNNVCIKKIFLKDINKVLEINENSVIGYNQSSIFEYNEEDDKKILNKLNNNIISSNYTLKINICAISVNSNLLNKDIGDFTELVDNLNLKYITKTSYFNSVSKNDKYYRYSNNNNYIFGELKNNDNLKLIDNNIKNYHYLLKDVNFDNFNPKFIKNLIIKDLHSCNLSYIFIKNNDLEYIEKLVKNISEIELNNIFNVLIFSIDLKNKEDINNILKKHDLNIYRVLYINEELKPLFQIIDKIPYYSDIYLLDNEKFINFKNTGFNINIENNKLYLYKFPKFIFNFFNLNKQINKLLDDKYNFIKIKNFLSNIIVTHFSKLITYNNIVDNSKDLCIDNNITLEINKDFLIELYDNSDWTLLNFLLILILENKLDYDDNILVKIISILPYSNEDYPDILIQKFISSFEIDNFIELLNICYILIGNEKYYILDIILEKYLLLFAKEKDNILGLLYLLNESNIYEKEVDITNDTKYLTFLLDNFDYIEENLDKIVSFNESLDTHKIMNNILLYLLPRNDLIENISKDFIKKINKIYINFFNINLRVLDETISDKIVKFFNLSPLNSINYFISISEVMLTTEDILLKRENAYLFFKILNNNIDKLVLDKICVGIDKKLLNIISVFKYSYHGISNKNLFKEIFKFFKYLFNKVLKNDCSNLKDLDYIEDNDIYNYKFENTNKKKIIFISDFLTRKHSVFKDRHQVICNLAKKNFDVYIGHYSNLDYKYSNIYKNVKKFKLVGALLEDVNNLRKENFDKVVFCEIGMDQRAHILSLFKLGRVHYNTWGHSDTSGIDVTDYYVSSKLYELDYNEAQDNYSEKLILQNGMCTCYVNPSKDMILDKPRTYYGLSKNEFIILCPQSLFKIYPDYDEYIFEMLLQNPNITVVFIDALDKKYKMYERWDNKIDKKYFGVLSRVKFIGGLSHSNFVNLIKLSDLMIDPYPFGGCNTSLEAFSVGTPVVTQPSRMINGRFTHGFYKRMGFLDLVANSKEEYISITSRLINDKDFYNNCVDKINKNSHILFEDQETLDEWEELMSQ